MHSGLPSASCMGDKRWLPCRDIPCRRPVVPFRDKEKKPFTNLDGRAVWLRTVEQFVTRNDVSQCIVVVAPEDQEMFRRRFGANLVFMNIQIANGGAERFESVANALALVKPEVDFVAVHDAVRPCITEAQINMCSTRPRRPARPSSVSPSPTRSSR